MVLCAGTRSTKRQRARPKLVWIIFFNSLPSKTLLYVGIPIVDVRLSLQISCSCTYDRQAKRNCTNLGEHINQTFDQCLQAIVKQLKEYARPFTTCGRNAYSRRTRRISGSFEAIFWPKLPAASQPLNPPVANPEALSDFRKSFSLLLLVQISYVGGYDHGRSILNSQFCACSSALKA